MMAKHDAQLLKLALKGNARLEDLVAELRDEIGLAREQLEMAEKRRHSLVEADAAHLREKDKIISALKIRNEQLRRVVNYLPALRDVVDAVIKTQTN